MIFLKNLLSLFFFLLIFFLFENSLLFAPELHQIVSKAWLESSGVSVSKLTSCVDSLFIWGKELPLRFKKEIDKCKKE